MEDERIPIHLTAGKPFVWKCDGKSSIKPPNKVDMLMKLYCLYCNRFSFIRCWAAVAWWQDWLQACVTHSHTASTSWHLGIHTHLSCHRSQKERSLWCIIVSCNQLYIQCFLYGPASFCTVPNPLLYKVPNSLICVTSSQSLSSIKTWKLMGFLTYCFNTLCDHLHLWTVLIHNT